MTTLVDLSSKGLNYIPFNIIQKNKKVTTVLLNNNNIRKLINFSELNLIKKIDISRNSLENLDALSVNIITEEEKEEKEANEGMGLAVSPNVAERRDTRTHGVPEALKAEREKKEAQKIVDNRRELELKKELDAKEAQFNELQAKYNILEEDRQNKPPGFKPAGQGGVPRVQRVPQESFVFLNNNALEELYLHNNVITNISPSIGRLTRLEILTLDNNKLLVLPDAIYDCRELKVLTLSNNKITQISPLIKQLIKLEILNVSRNLITILPEEISSNKLLKELDISLNTITTLTDALDELTVLQILNVSNNRLTQLPITITRMQSLEVLDISNNIITALPENIGSLERLNIFNMQHNLLVDLPSSISNIVSLHTLVLHNNKFTIVPNSIRHLKRLMTDRFELLPNNYIGIYKDVKIGLNLKNLFKYTYSLLTSFVESVELENIFLLDFDMNTFMIYDNNKHERVLMNAFINEDKLNYVILYITNDDSNIYHGIGFNKNDEKKYIIECDRTQKILPYEKLIAEKIYDTDTGIIKKYMNALYESDSSIFFASDEYEIRNGTAFNETVTNINLKDELNFCRNFSDMYMYNKLYVAQVGQIDIFIPPSRTLSSWVSFFLKRYLRGTFFETIGQEPYLDIDIDRPSLQLW
jgi:Leucine-rich repeat (LRR) protein